MSERLPVFVYGTLRPGQPGFDEMGLGARVDLLGPASVIGTLYDLGDYPGALLQGDGVIVGDLLRPRDDAVLSSLDSFELFDPEDPAASEYLRVPTCLLNGGRSVWIYVYNFSLTEARVIPSGDWLRRA